MRQTLLDERKSQLRDVVENAYSVLETANFYEPAQAAIASMRFGEDRQNYFFVIDQKGMFWVNPDQPELIGRVSMDLTDLNGKRYIKQIIHHTQAEKQSFIRYRVKKPDSSDPSTKLVHFKSFEKWNWIVCAGIFIDDIETIIKKKEDYIQSAMINQIKLLSLAELLVFIISVTVSTILFQIKLVKPIEKLTQAAEEMVAGNFKNKINIKANYEIDQLANAIQRMQVSFAILYERLRAIKTKSKAVKHSKNGPKKVNLHRLSKDTEESDGRIGRLWPH